MNNDYDQRRYERLKEIVAEYLDDEGDCPSRFIEHLHMALVENSRYFKGRVDAYARVKELFQ